MTERDAERAFVREWQRVLGADADGRTDFFTFTGPPDTAARLVAWLRTLPAGLGVAELERRWPAHWGDPPAG